MLHRATAVQGGCRPHHLSPNRSRAIAPPAEGHTALRRPRAVITRPAGAGAALHSRVRVPSGWPVATPPTSRARSSREGAANAALDSANYTPSQISAAQASESAIIFLGECIVKSVHELRVGARAG